MIIQLKRNCFIKCSEKYGYIADEDNNVQYTFSESGKYILSQLSYSPKSTHTIVKYLQSIYSEVSFEKLYNDTKDFLLFLSKENLIVIDSNTHQEENSKCIDQKDYNVYKLSNLTVELTKACNERCVHCYLPNDIKDKKCSISIADIKKTIDLFWMNGGQNITFTGGEPLLYTDFNEVIEYATSKGMEINLLSNLTEINESKLRIIKESNINSIQTSLYGSSPYIHDNITRRKGSFQKTKEAIEKLTDIGIPVTVSCCVLKENKEDIGNILALGKSLGVEVKLETNITPCMNGSSDNLRHRINLSEFEDLCKNLLLYDYDAAVNMFTKHKHTYDKNYNLLEYLHKPLCSIAQNGLYITSEGNFVTCPTFQSVSLGNIAKDNIIEIWNSHSLLRKYRTLKEDSFPKCVRCEAADYCVRCIARNYTETGNCMTFPNYACQMAFIIKNIIDKKELKCL